MGVRMIITLFPSGRRPDASKETPSAEQDSSRNRSAMKFAMPYAAGGSVNSLAAPPGQGNLLGFGKLLMSKKKDTSQSYESSPVNSKAGISSSPAPPTSGASKSGLTLQEAEARVEESRKSLLKKVPSLSSMSAVAQAAAAAMNDPNFRPAFPPPVLSPVISKPTAEVRAVTSEETAAIVKRDFMRQSVSMQARGGHGIVKSLATLAPFVPKLLKDDIVFNDARYQGFDSANIRNLGDISKNLAPCMEEVQAAIMIADVKGFTRLTEILSRKGTEGVELLTNCMNNYFTRVIDLINSYDGDVIKFAGDSLIVAFTPSGQEREQSESEPDGDLGLRFAAMRATKCALELSTRLGHMRMKMNGQVEPAQHMEKHGIAEDSATDSTDISLLGSQLGSLSTQRTTPFDLTSSRPLPVSTNFSGLAVRGDMDATTSGNPQLNAIPSEITKGPLSNQPSALLDQATNMKRKGLLTSITESMGIRTSSTFLSSPALPTKQDSEREISVGGASSVSLGSRSGVRKSLRRGLKGPGAQGDGAEADPSARTSETWDVSLVQREASLNTRLNIPPPIVRQGTESTRTSTGGQASSSEQSRAHPSQKGRDFAGLLQRIPVHNSMTSSPNPSPSDSSRDTQHTASPLGRPPAPSTSPALDSSTMSSPGSPHGSRSTRVPPGSWESTFQVLASAAVSVSANRSSSRISDGKRTGSSSSTEAPRLTDQPSRTSTVPLPTHALAPERSRLSQSSLTKEPSELTGPYPHAQPTAQTSANAILLSGAAGLPPLGPSSGAVRTTSDQNLRSPGIARSGSSFNQQHSAMHQKLFKKQAAGSPSASRKKTYVTRGSRSIEDAVSSDEERGSVTPYGGGNGGVEVASVRSESIESADEKSRLHWSEDSYGPDMVRQGRQLSSSTSRGQPGPVCEGVEGEGQPGINIPVNLQPARDIPVNLQPGSSAGSSLISVRNSALPPHILGEIEAQVSEGVLFNDALRRGRPSATDSDGTSPKGSFAGMSKGSFVNRLSSWFSVSSSKGIGGGGGGSSQFAAPPGSPIGNILGMIGGSPRSLKSSKASSSLAPSASFDDLNIRSGPSTASQPSPHHVTIRGHKPSLLSQGSSNGPHVHATGVGGAGSSNHSRLGMSSPQNPQGAESMRSGYYGGSVASRRGDPIMEEVLASKFSLKLIVAAGCVCAFHVGG
jgi:hypothetical protein